MGIEEEIAKLQRGMDLVLKKCYQCEEWAKPEDLIDMPCQHNENYTNLVHMECLRNYFEGTWKWTDELRKQFYLVIRNKVPPEKWYEISDFLPDLHYKTVETKKRSSKKKR